MLGNIHLGLVRFGDWKYESPRDCFQCGGLKHKEVTDFAISGFASKQKTQTRWCLNIVPWNKISLSSGGNHAFNSFENVETQFSVLNDYKYMLPVSVGVNYLPYTYPVLGQTWLGSWALRGPKENVPHRLPTWCMSHKTGQWRVGRRFANAWPHAQTIHEKSGADFGLEHFGWHVYQNQSRILCAASVCST